MGPEELQVPGLAEDHFIDGEMLVEPNDREADASGDVLAVGKHEADVLLLPGDAELLQRLLGDPGELASGVDQQPRHDSRPRTIHGILDFALRVEEPSALCLAHHATDPTPPGSARR